MVGAFAPVEFVNLWLPFVALELFSFLNSQRGAAGTTTSDQASLLGSAGEFFVLPLAAVVVLFVAVALMYHHLMGRHAAAVPVAAAAGNGRRSISGLVMLLLCVSAGTLQFVVFGQAAASGGGGGAGHGAQVRALGLAALRALPAAATVTFFCGMMLIVANAALVRAAGEPGGTGAVAGDGPNQGLLRFLTKVAVGAAATLVVLMAMSLAVLVLHGAKY